MTAPIAVLCLLLTAGAGGMLDVEPSRAQYRREGGKFTSSPDATISVASLIPCAISCTAMESWFCGGFTYYGDGSCDLYKGNDAAVCVNPEVAAPPLEVDTSTGPRSYRRLLPTCPGTLSSPCACPAGFSRCAGRCLTKLNQQLNHTDAEAACDELGAHLAVPRSEPENRCAMDMADGEVIWLGATDPSGEGAFVGADGTCGPVPLSTAWWSSGQPDSTAGEELCMDVFNTGKWNDDVCAKRTVQPLCQLRSCYQPQCP